MNLIHRSIFLKEIKEHYPQLTSELNKQESMFDWEVSVFLKFVQERIDNGDQQNSRILLERVGRYYRSGDQALKEHIRNGVCEDMRFEDSKKIVRSWSKEYLSDPLKAERESWISLMGEKYRI